MLIITNESVPKKFWRVGCVSDRERRALSRRTVAAECMRQDQINRGVLFAEASPAYQFFPYSHIDDNTAVTKVTVDAALREFLECSKTVPVGDALMSQAQRDPYWFLRTIFRDRWKRQKECYTARFPEELRESLGLHLSRTEWRLSNELTAIFSSERALLNEMSRALDARQALYHEIPISHRGG